MLEYDDGVYYAASRLLLHGHLPYSDVTIVHPPGLSLLLLPAALVGELAGSATGMAAARVEMQLFTVANTVLVYLLARLLRGTTERRALLAAALYAVMPNAVSAGHTVLLEPLATTACLGADWLLLRRGAPTRDLLGAGALLAAGVSLKLFAAAYVVAAFVVLARRPRALMPLAAGGLVGALVLLAPFFLADPSAAWHDIVVTQLSRPVNPTVPSGLDRLVSMVGLGWATVPLGLVLLVVLLVTAVREVADPVVRMFASVLLLAGTAFLTSPTYFLHYGEFLGPAVALLATRALDLPRLGRVAVAATAVCFAIGTVADTNLDGQADLRRATAPVAAGDCVYFDAVSLALAAEVYRDPSPTCPSYVDGRGVALTQNPHWDDRRSFYPAGFVADRRWQAAARDQMSHARWLLLRSDPATFPEWDAQTRAYAVEHFQPVVQEDGGRQPFQLWRRRA